MRVSSLTQEGIESNSGPSSIRKEQQPSRYQSNFRYGDSAGMQCTSNTYVSIIYSAGSPQRILKNLWKNLREIWDFQNKKYGRIMIVLLDSQ